MRTNCPADAENTVLSGQKENRGLQTWMWAGQNVGGVDCASLRAWWRCELGVGDAMQADMHTSKDEHMFLLSRIVAEFIMDDYS
ncbi:uncharacterized protein EI97DRAFT_240789 [Westerdykella ornata]|uniref:Uncharacterized protein n=1 Tax=Westerdykella ornata TaxID=318751 RepID=A0A6A6J6U2_WESOR|nr:uncharacterized protein EI97DRAFT_240789 [Westerdykella ornata]KAF2271937.1 hypothetical protein EI97DRAFT_240789 [Westerdykella ornata]